MAQEATQVSQRAPQDPPRRIEASANQVEVAGLSEQRFSFDEISRLYDRCRPGYPAALFEEIARTVATTAGPQAIEIGCGTGQATRDIAQLGFHVVALEPGENLAELARDNLAGLDVEVRCESFESANLPSASVDLVVAAQSWHWVDPEVAFAKAARVLRPGGFLAVLGNAVVDTPSALRSAIHSAYEAHAPEIAGPPVTRWYSAGGPFEELFLAAEGFQSPKIECYPWSETLPTPMYLDLLRTHSDLRMLPEASRSSLLDAVATAIDADGGSISIDYEAMLYMAARAARQGAEADSP